MLESAGLLELVVILFIAVVVFGVGKLPQAAVSLGKAIKEFKKAAKDPADKTTLKAPRPRATEGYLSGRFGTVVAIDTSSGLLPGRIVPLIGLGTSQESLAAPILAA